MILAPVRTHAASLYDRSGVCENGWLGGVLGKIVQYPRRGAIEPALKFDYRNEHEAAATDNTQLWLDVAVERVTRDPQSLCGFAGRQS